jgi:4-hydroxy-L-threonine phosphate dehydrogenase PdxA
MNKKPVVCVLLGDASGVGSEILVKAFGGDAKVPEAVRVALLGDERVLARAEELIGKKISYKLVKPEEIRETEEDIVMVDTKNVDPAQAPFAKVNAVCGKAVVEDIKAACNYYVKGYVDGICFAPFNKEAIRMNYPEVASELEIFKKYCEELGLTVDNDFGEMNVVDGLWTTRVTSHIPLTKLADYLTYDKIMSMIRLADKSCRASGIENPRIAVCALNPHCGEGGLCGDEEQTLIKPAIEQGRTEGYNIIGMYSADTVFVHAFNGEADVVVTMYHDQGQIALKLKEFSHARRISFSRSTIFFFAPIPFIRSEECFSRQTGAITTGFFCLHASLIAFAISSL